MKILYVTSKVPYPVSDGGCFAMMQFIYSLQDPNWIVDGFIFSTQKHPFLKASSDYLSNYFRKIQTLELDTSVKPFAAFWHLITRNNYNLKRFQSSQLETPLKKQLNEDYDIVIFDSLFAAALLPKLKQHFRSRFIVRAHNVEHEIWRTLADEEKNKLKKQYLKALYQTLEKEEAQILNVADQIWTMSEDDSKFMKLKNISTPIHYIPVAIEQSDEKADLTKSTCFHLGSMNWQPNIEAVNYLAVQLWSKNSALPQLTIAGSHSESIDRSRFPESISVVGRVPNVNQFMQSAGILVSPIQSGSGIRIKLLEALALGVPCITTKLGAAGIDAEAAGILIAETPQEWFAQIEMVANSIELRTQNSKKSLAYISNKHSFAYCKSLIDAALGS